LTEFFVDVLAYNFTSKDNELILYAILRKNTELFPGSPSAYETFAYACFKNGDKRRAIENYKRVLKLDPENRNAERMIERLGKK
jgi:tetratricopeptide (TPR) repeat protein